MARSRTRKKSSSKITSPEIKQIATIATDYIKHWTMLELSKLQQANQIPICIPTASGYRIGVYLLTIKSDNACELYNAYHELMHVFESKISAVLYTIYIIKQKYSFADEILVLDKQINKSYIESLILQRTIDRARFNKLYDIVDIRQSRLDISQRQLTQARNEMATIYKRAKINRVWE